jgi:Tol biopolymer transport system component
MSTRGRRRVVSLLLLGVATVVTTAGSVAARQPQAAEEIVFRSNRADGLNELYVIGRDGLDLRRLTFDGSPVRTPRFSPDGTRIAFASAKSGNFDIWTINRDGTGLRRLTSDPEREEAPSWTVTGEILFQRGPFACETGCSAVVVPADGGAERTLPIGDIGPGGLDASPHGERLLFARDRSIWVAGFDGSAARRLTVPAAGESDFRPAWAPSGNRFAFVRDSGGLANDLWVGTTSGEQQRLTQTPARHEEYPSWSAAKAGSGEEILFSGFFDDGRSRLYRIAPDGSGDAEVSTDLHAPFLDTFSRDGRDSSLWHEIVTGTEVTVAQTGGRVEVSIGAGAVQGGPFNGIDGHYGSQCRLPGDFDIQVEYDALAWPAANGTQAALQAFFANASVARESQLWGEQYTSWLDGVGGSATTEENTGALRLVRSGGRFRAFWRYEGVWVPIRSGPANANAAVFGFSLQSFNLQFAHRPVRVAFDNFRLASGEVSCPDWWTSGFGDLG